MRELTIRSATRDDALYVAEHLRREDAQEARAASGLSPRDALLFSFSRSEECLCGVGSSGVPLGLFGFRHETWLWVTPWMLCCDVPQCDWRAFMRTSRRLAAELEGRYKFQRNFVDFRHKQAIKWLTKLDYTIGEPRPYGPFGLPFCEFFKANKEGGSLWEL